MSSDSALLYHTCRAVLLNSPEVTYVDASGHTFEGMTSFGPFKLDNYLDSLSQNSVDSRMNAATRVRLLNESRSCFVIQHGPPSSSLGCMILHPRDLTDNMIKDALLRALKTIGSDEPDHPVVYTGREIIEDPFSRPWLSEVYACLRAQIS